MGVHHSKLEMPLPWARAEEFELHRQHGFDPVKTQGLTMGGWGAARQAPSPVLSPSCESQGARPHFLSLTSPKTMKTAPHLATWKFLGQIPGEAQTDVKTEGKCCVVGKRPAANVPAPPHWAPTSEHMGSTGSRRKRTNHPPGR